MDAHRFSGIVQEVGDTGRSSITMRMCASRRLVTGSSSGRPSVIPTSSPSSPTYWANTSPSTAPAVRQLVVVDNYKRNYQVKPDNPWLLCPAPPCRYSCLL